MLLRGTTSSVQPCAVAVDEKADGGKIVRICGEVSEIQEDGQTIYQYDEVVFELEPGRTETASDIEECLADWWEYGSQEEEAAPTLEERVAMLEDYIISGGEI